MVAAMTLADRERARELDRARFGLTVFLISKAMFFVAIIGAYIVLRQTQVHAWPPPGTPELTLHTAGPNTALLMISALTAMIAPWAIRRDRRQLAGIGVGVTLLLGLVFMGVQIWEWVDLSRRGLKLSVTYGSCYYLLTAFHGLYVLGGLALFARVGIRLLRGAYDRSRLLGIDMAALWWHFVGAVWLMLFGALYVLPRMGG